MATRPLDAASLVLVRRAAGRDEVLMGRRAPGHRFLPDLFVFPGGRVDAGDHRVVAASALRESTRAALTRTASQARAHALAVAAVRETWEETGLLLGTLRGGRLRPSLDVLEFIARAITPSDSLVRFHARFFLADGTHAAGELRGSGELLDLAWRPIDACLALPLADITEFVLRQVARRGRGEAGELRAPLYAYRGGRVLLRAG